MAVAHTLYYYLWNIGCQMNQADATRIAEGFEAQGMQPTRDPGQAQVMLLNTCVVRQSAQDKVTGRLNSLKPLVQGQQPRLLLLMGCFVGDLDEMARQYPFVHRFLRPSDVAGALEASATWLEEQHLREGQALEEPLSPQAVADAVPISYGCDHHCTYCIVTIRRGDQRSRAIEDIARDVRALVARGAREITLLGQNVDAYGSDLDPEERLAGRSPDLADILYAIHEIEGLWRIRFLTSHPREMSQRIIDAVAALPKVCPTWELAVQSGDDQVLRRMARGYTAAQVRELVGRIRSAAPGCTLNTDIIVGFCGETDEEFGNTMQLLRDLRFDMVHIAAYSVRPGTPAAQWEDDVPAEVKESRRLEVEALQEEIAEEINAANLGQVVEILVDGQQRGRWRGRTVGNKLVFFDIDPDDPRDWLGHLAQVRITWTGAWSMIGEPLAQIA